MLEAVADLRIPRLIPVEGISPTDLHTTLDGTRFLALPKFADWTWGQTDRALLDLDDEIEVAGADWRDESIQGIDALRSTSVATRSDCASLDRKLLAGQPTHANLGRAEPRLGAVTANHVGEGADAAASLVMQLAEFLRRTFD